MAFAQHVYPQFQQKCGTKLVNLSTDTLKVMLLATYTYANTHATMTDVRGAGTETVGTGYTAGGQALTSVVFSTSGWVTSLTASNPSWASATFSAAYAVFYDAQGGSDSTNYPFEMWDFGGTQSPAGVTFPLVLPAGGIYALTGS